MQNTPEQSHKIKRTWYINILAILVALLTIALLLLMYFVFSGKFYTKIDQPIDIAKATQEFIKYENLDADKVILSSDNDSSYIFYIKNRKLIKYDLVDKKTTILESFVCTNGFVIEFSYGIDSYIFDGNKIMLIGGSGGLGEFAGYYVIIYEAQKNESTYVCFGRVIESYGKIIEVSARQLVRDNGHHLQNDYVYHTSYYNSNGDEIIPRLFEGSIGRYPIVMELVDTKENGGIIGSYYYRKQGPDNRMYIQGGINGRSLILYGYTYRGKEAELIETISGLFYSNRIEGKWRSNLNNKELPIILEQDGLD